MGSHRDRTIVPFTPHQMFDLVADVEDYPRFIPWIEALRVRKREGTPAQGELTADMVVKYKMFRESFRSEVNLDREAGTIDVTYVRGPLKSLTNNWGFEDHPEGCLIDFCIDFEFRNILMQTLANQLIDKAFMRLSGAFIDEAHRRHPKIIEKRHETS
ncbi:MAG: type II toxin-antitoxin system RatA family toxin [Pseudomonadota bacterium]